MNSQYLSRIAVLIEAAFVVTMTFTASLAASQQPGLSFAPAVTYDTAGIIPSSVALADVNGDGKPDLIVAQTAGTVAVLLGNGDGTFQKAVTYNTLGGYYPLSVAVADVNADGKPDIIIANYCSYSDCFQFGSVDVLLGNGDGTFRRAVTYDTGGDGPLSVAVADVNGDGKPDIIVSNSCSNEENCTNGSVDVLLGNGDGTFQKAVTFNTSGYHPTSVAVADVNGDGKPDIIVANQCKDEFCYTLGVVAVLLGNGDGTFQKAVTYVTGTYTSTSVVVADVNGDGKPDIILAGEDPAGNGVVTVRLGNGNGAFQKPVTYNSGGYFIFFFHTLAVGDVNGDGKPDIVVSNACGNDHDYCSDETPGVVGVLINTSPWPPDVTISANPTILWPPNGKLVPVTVSGAITDRGGGVNASSAEYTVVDEYREVQPSGPIILGLEGKYSTTVWLQASRNGSDMDGRKYTIIVSAKNNLGELGSASTVVTVPHDQGR